MTSWTGQLMTIGNQFWIIGDPYTDVASLDYTSPETVLTSPDHVGIISPGDYEDITVTVTLSAEPVHTTSHAPVVEFTQPATIMLTDGSLPTDPQLAQVQIPPGRYTITEQSETTPDGRHHRVSVHPIPD